MWLAVDNSLHPLFDPKGNADRRTLELAQTDVLRDPRWRYARRAPDKLRKRALRYWIINRASRSLIFAGLIRPIKSLRALARTGLKATARTQ